MSRTRQKDLYAVMSEPWAKAPLEYLATTHHAIVSRFEGSFRYVSLHPENAKTFSYEFASILRDACSAFASFGSAVIIRDSKAPGWQEKDLKDLNINDFFVYYSRCSPDLSRTYIEIRSLPEACQLRPFRDWTEHKVPAWWQAHNNIKHSEFDHVKEGNLQNATNAVAAVQIVLGCATPNEKGTRLFSPWGANPAENIPLENIPLLFEP